MADIKITEMPAQSVLTGDELIPAVDLTRALALQNRKVEIEQIIPKGGTTGQVLTKTSGTNYATQWATPSGGGGGASSEVFFRSFQYLDAIPTSNQLARGLEDSVVTDFADSFTLQVGDIIEIYYSGRVFPEVTTPLTVGLGVKNTTDGYLYTNQQAVDTATPGGGWFPFEARFTGTVMEDGAEFRIAGRTYITDMTELTSPLFVDEFNNSAAGIALGMTESEVMLTTLAEPVSFSTFATAGTGGTSSVGRQIGYVRVLRVPGDIDPSASIYHTFIVELDTDSVMAGTSGTDSYVVAWDGSTLTITHNLDLGLYAVLVTSVSANTAAVIASHVTTIQPDYFNVVFHDDEGAEASPEFVSIQITELTEFA